MTARFRRVRRERERGVALIAVLGYTMVITLLLTLTAVEGQRMIAVAGKSQERHTATQAAHAAVNDYLARANADSAYTRFAHVPASACPGAATTPTLDPANALMGTTASDIPGGPSKSKARYTVDVSDLCSMGIIRVAAVGRAGKTDANVSFTLRRRSFLDYTYFSDFEALDPSKYATNPFAPDTVEHVCRRHHYMPSAHDATKARPVWPAPRPEQGLNQNPGCATINWLTGDRVSGPVHTNDAMLICGNPQFLGVVTTSYPVASGTKRYLRNPGCHDNARFYENSERRLCPPVEGPCYAPPLQLPPVNTELSAVPGACVYKGPTRITTRATRFDVVSPNTTSARPGCGPGMNLSYPASGVIYVQNAPASPAPVACATPTGNLSPRNPVGYPIAGDITTYGCTSGDAFVSSQVNQYLTDRITIGAQNRIIVTDNLYTANAEEAPTAALGLVSNSSIEIYHPVDTAGTNLVTPLRTVQAAMLSINGSVSVQNYNQGAHLGRLRVTGVLAQRWRGLIGTTDKEHGYGKEYGWDPRLSTVTPPHFIEPVNASWQIVKTDQ